MVTVPPVFSHQFSLDPIRKKPSSFQPQQNPESNFSVYWISTFAGRLSPFGQQGPPIYIYLVIRFSVQRNQICCLPPLSFLSRPRRFVVSRPVSRSFRIVMATTANNIDSSKKKIVHGDAGYVLEDVPHLSDYIPDLPVRFFPTPSGFDLLFCRSCD